MDELFQLVLQFMQQVEQNVDSLDDDESLEIANFLNEVMGFIQQAQQRPLENRQIEAPMPMGVELLWLLSGQNPNAFVNYLRTYPGEGFEQLVSNPTQLASVIQRLQQTNPLQEPQVDQNGIQDTEFPSSNVAGMKYDPKSGKLLVKFHGENAEPIYEYSGVPPQIFQLLQHGNAFAKTRGKNKWGEWWPMKNPSIGASINQFLKAGGYAYQRIS